MTGQYSGLVGAARTADDQKPLSLMCQQCDQLKVGV